MIFGQFHELKNYKGTSKMLDKALELIESGEFLKGEPGKNVVEGDDLFFNLVEVDTRELKDCFFETHKDYIDIHVVVEGEENIGYALQEELKAENEYDKCSDFQKFGGEAKQIFTIKNDRFIVFYPEEPHMPLMAIGEPKKIKKAIFKIKL
ncbi:YhcH/YjgK/YiaL family protein [Cetobacterium ceti]